LLIGLGLWLYGRMLINLLAGRGKVVSGAFSLSDMAVVVILGSYLGAMAAHGFRHPEIESRSMTNADLVQSAVLFGMIVAGIIFFLKFRGGKVVELFGFRQLTPMRIVRRGGLLLLAALPMIILCNAAMNQALGDQAEPQEIVQYFSHAARHSQWLRVLATVTMAVVIAPMEEEFLFRGYIYGVLRRHLGVVPALLLNAALFSAIHLNLPALPALFVLALCLTLAYESTGSLLVPMVMHSMFNATMLGAIFFTGV
jgi:membrane protease YdiL (CAAX protease family)